MKKITPEEYLSQFPWWDVDSRLNEDIKYFYLSDLDECPYIGIERTDGTVWVYGLKVDCEVEGVDDLEWYLNQV